MNGNKKALMGRRLKKIRKPKTFKTICEFLSWHFIFAIVAHASGLIDRASFTAIYVSTLLLISVSIYLGDQ